MPLVVARAQLVAWLTIAILGVLPMVGLVDITVWWGVFGALTVVAIVDALIAVMRAQPEAKRDLPHSLSLGVEHEAALVLENRRRTPLVFDVFDRVPDTIRYFDLPKRVRLPGGEGARITYRLEPTERGTFVFDGIDTRVSSPLRLWWRQSRIRLEDHVRVYPNFRAVARYALLATENRLSLLGIKKRQRRGVGTEFQELRDYQPGDPLRAVDWRATSRVRRVIARDYQDERDQQLLFLVDAGRRMHSRDGTLSHLDHALNAVLLLGHVALSQGDSVGLMSFGSEERWLSPAKGQQHLNALLNTVFDLQTDPIPGDVEGAVRRVLGKLRKRTLLVVVTNLRDETDEELVAGLSFAGRRHLVLLTSLREIALREASDAPIHDFDDALRYAATQHYLRHRSVAHARLAMAGVLHVDVAPNELAVQLVNQYLAVKASGRL